MIKAVYESLKLEGGTSPKHLQELLKIHGLRQENCTFNEHSVNENGDSIHSVLEYKKKSSCHTKTTLFRLSSYLENKNILFIG